MPSNKRRATQLSLGVIRKQKPAVDVETSAHSNADDVAADLEEFLLLGLPDGETLPDTALLQRILGNIVRLHGEAMEGADEAHFAALSRVNHFLLVRDDFTGRLFPKLVEIRDTFDAAFGLDTCQRILGIGTGIPSEPLKVRRLSDRVVQRFEAPDFVLPPKRSQGVAVDTVQWVSEVRPDLEGLRQSMKDLSEARREADRTLEAKDETIEVYVDTYGRCSRLLETFYLVAKRDRLANKLRPTTPKPRSSEKPDEPAESREQAAAEGEDGDEEEPSLADQSVLGSRPDRPPAEARSAETRSDED